MSEPQIQHGKYVRLSDGSVFPLAISLDDDINGIEWQLRYAPNTVTRGDMLRLASIVSAYNALVFDSTRAKRDLVARDIRKAVAQARHDTD